MRLTSQSRHQSIGEAEAMRVGEEFTPALLIRMSTFSPCGKVLKIFDADSSCATSAAMPVNFALVSASISDAVASRSCWVRPMM